MEEPIANSWNYCRFCAERKNDEKLMKLDSDSPQITEVVRKLTILKLKLFTCKNSNITLPNTICFVCWSKFNSAYEFFETFQKAQDILQRFNPDNHENEKNSLDDDLHSNCADFTSLEVKDEVDEPLLYCDDFTSLEDKDEDDEPLINLGKHKNKQSNGPSSSNNPIPKPLIKSEKHEGFDKKSSETTPSYSQTVPSFKEHSMEDQFSIGTTDESNIFNSLFASSCLKTDSTPNVGFYGEELSLEPKIYIKKWKDYPWICLYCSVVLPSIESLREHSQLIHFKCAAFRCIDCASYSENYDYHAFIRHVRKHRKHLRKVCPYCDIKTDDYKSHITTHFSNPTTQNCNVCGELFFNQDQYAQHLQYITNNNKKERRIETQEVKPKRKRRKAGQIITIEDLTCDVCHKVYKNLNILRDHKRVMHSTENRRTFTCERCGKTFLNKGSLTTHIMGHDKIKPFQCRLCNKGFKFPNLLRRHVDTHSGVKKFKCDQCGRAFRLLSQMNKHKIVHTDVMPFVCEYCPKSFRFKSILDIHERQHTGAKPYSCNECDMEFTNWSNYNKHSKRRHGIDLSKKKITPLGSFPVNPLTGRVIELDDSVACEEWKKQVMLPCKRGPKKGVKKMIL